MRKLRIRISVGRLMAAIAILASGMGAVKAYHRWVICAERLGRYEAVERGFRQRQRNEIILARICEDWPLDQSSLEERLGAMDWDGLGCEVSSTSMREMRGLGEAERLARAADCRGSAEMCLGHAEVCARFKRIYRAAVWRPWLPVPTGPTAYVD